MPIPIATILTLTTLLVDLALAGGEFAVRAAHLNQRLKTEMSKPGGVGIDTLMQVEEDCRQWLARLEAQRTAPPPRPDA